MMLGGRYETLELLGSGGMGDVYLASDLENRTRRVAVKLLKEEVSDDIVMRFDRECELLSRVSHPAIVKVLDRGAADKQVYFVMEYVAWPTLAQRLTARQKSEQPFSLQEAVALLARLADALDHLPGLGIVHRDLKPSNVLVSDELDLRVIDFGLAG
ncbi:MAG: serine/threonine protein kinase, partial [Candidatus Riflebacteria bacterium]|nr:serine/threonine protein kinase [Candidatus Riflebacteria bacterium]